MWCGSDYWFGIVCGGSVITVLLLCVVEGVITGSVLCVVGQCLLVWYCVWWGSDYWLSIVFVGSVITGL